MFNMNPYSQSLIRVTGIESAKAYPMSANSTIALFDSNEDLMYIKSTDGAGFPTIRTFKFQEIEKNETANYVSREEMEEYVKQFIQKQNKQFNGNGQQHKTE